MFPFLVLPLAFCQPELIRKVLDRASLTIQDGTATMNAHESPSGCGEWGQTQVGSDGFSEISTGMPCALTKHLI